jgi:Kef-type K+ transport system membrane component KefB
LTTDQIVRLLFALAVIALLAYAAGAFCRRLGQPPVIGEVLAGVVLGPTILDGALSNLLFPADIRPFLTVLANIGVALFMFTVGAEMDAALLRPHRMIAGTVATSSIVLPFGLGAALAAYLVGHHPAENRLGFILFLGAAMSVTAFPVLARILTDRGMHTTWLGNVALACAAIDDVLAWILLAVVVSIVGAGGRRSWLLLLFVPYLLAMAMVVRPALRRLLAGRADRGDPDRSVLVIPLVGLLLSAAFTEWIGLHFIFGAFLFGAVMPRAPGGFARLVSERISHVNEILLLPIFFVVAGLRVDLSGMDARALRDLGLILAVAVGGKFLGAYGAARFSGMRGRPATALAVLINTRGLTELIILTVGLQYGLLDGQLYSSMVVMALVTTAMAGPLLQRIYPVPKTVPETADQACR